MNHKLTNYIDPLKIAWLIRQDLRCERPLEVIPDDFVLWWLLTGKNEYQFFSKKKSPTTKKFFKPLSAWPVYGQFGITPLILHLVSTRKDLRDKFDISKENGFWQAIAWFYVHGLREYSLTNELDSNIFLELDKSPNFLANYVDSNNLLSVKINWLMYFVWISDQTLQFQFDINTKQGQVSFLSWFFCQGVHNLQLYPLISQRIKRWLFIRIPAPFSNALDLPRIALLYLINNPDLNKFFDISNVVGWNNYSKWFQNVELNKYNNNLLGSKQSTTLRHSNLTENKLQNFGVNIIGHAFGELGIGEDLRMAVAACLDAKIPFNVINIRPGPHTRESERSMVLYVEKSKSNPLYSINLFCLTGFETARIYIEGYSELFFDRYNIGWWPWELPVWPSDWSLAFDLVDEIWAASNFTYEMYSNTFKSLKKKTGYQKVVTLMPMAASVSNVKLSSRIKFGLPENMFLFLYIFDFNSYITRKNPIAIVDSFHRAFSNFNINVGLVIKTMNCDRNNKIWNLFLEKCKQDKRIIIIDSNYHRSDILGLIETCDAFISLHRSEGFGRALAEAMLFGKAVIATSFSGNNDFLKPGITFPVKYRRVSVGSGDYPFIKSSDAAWWAEPDLEDAALQMQAAIKIGKKNYFRKTVKHFAENQFSTKRIGQMINFRLRRCLKEYKRQKQIS